MAMEWVSKYCRSPKYIVKTDDDVFVNMFRLIHLTKTLKEKDAKSLKIYCNGWNSGANVNRNKKSKWYVSKKEFRNDKYDKYCSGFFLIIVNDLIPLLYNRSFHTPFFWVDDYWMTGMVAKEANVTLSFRNDIIQYQENGLSNFQTKKAFQILLAIHLDDQNLMLTLWDYLFRINMKEMFYDLEIENQYRFYKLFQNLNMIR